MASGTEKICDFIYRIPQEEGMLSIWPFEKKGRMPFRHSKPASYTGRDDYYICDANGNPRMCALLGGNLRTCLYNYNAKACPYCEDLGNALRCEIRGWNTQHKLWERVPIYPRDLLGETYRDQWRNVYARPMLATVDIPKALMRGGVENFKVSSV